MAVDSHHLLLSPPSSQLFSNRDVMMNNNNNNNQIGYGVVSPFFLTDDSPPPSLYGDDNTLQTTTYFADGSFFPTQTRKRSRDSSFYINHQHQQQNLRSSSSSCVTNTNTNTQNTTPYSFLGQEIDISSHINQQYHEIDRFVSLHMERVRYEMEEKRKKQARTIMEAIEQGLAKRLRVKEEERDRIGRLNQALEERVKSLSVENQIWRDLAQSNEATANNLRNNLEQVLAQVNINGAGLGNGDGFANVREVEEEGDAESCCGSSSEEETVRKRRLEGEAYDKMCRKCGEEESCVLLLPCRHLCLCGVCGSSVHTCPICRASKNASVHVNMSSS